MRLKGRVELDLQNRILAKTLAAAGLAVPIPFFFPVFQGCVQIYKRQYLKGAGFFLHAIISGYLSVSDSELPAILGTGMLIGGYVFSIIDANLSAKKINQQRLKSGPSNVNSAPPQILIGSYNVRF